MTGPAAPRHRRLAVGAVGGLVCTVALTVAASGWSAPETEPDPEGDSRPNVVVVLADDLGWSDLSSRRLNRGHPNPTVSTPAIDRLAEQGTAFDAAYASPTCSPSRMALLTGMYSPRPDNNVYSVGGLDRGGESRLLVGPPQGREDGRLVLPEGAVTVGETMRDAGYATAWAGKFHVTRFANHIDSQHGFEETFGGSRAGAVSRYHAHDGAFGDAVAPALDAYARPYTQAYVDSEVRPYSSAVPDARLDALVGTDKHVTDALGDATLDFVDAHAGEPFFAVMSHYAVHTPVGDRQPRSDLLAKYRDRTPRQAATEPPYAALVEGLDQTVARLVDHLETTPDPRNPGHPLADNTVVVLTSDNGGRTDVGASNGPLRGQKGELDEGGVRLPWVAWSGEEDLVAAGEVNHAPIDVTDLHPTLADYAGVGLPARTEPDGSSLRQALATGKRLERARFGHLPGYLLARGRDQRPESTLRQGRWKLRYSYEDRRFTLYDVEADLGERRDLSGRQPWRVAALGAKLVAWLDEVDAPLAILRAGRGPLRFTVRGTTYADGQARVHRRPTPIVVRPGEEVPLVLPDR